MFWGEVERFRVRLAVLCAEEAANQPKTCTGNDETSEEDERRLQKQVHNACSSGNYGVHDRDSTINRFRE